MRLFRVILLSMLLGMCQVEAETTIRGTVKVDGSSTVYPITEAVAEEFQKLQPGVRILVGISGTGGGFKKFIAGEIEIADASRPISEAESEQCKRKNIEYIELKVAIDALSVVVNPENSWASDITTADLRKIWEPAAQGKILKWSDVRPEWPPIALTLFGAGTDSGTFDYFTEAIVGETKACRGDYTSSEDDNVLVQGVAGTKGALGYFGASYYHGNERRLKALSVEGVLPTVDMVHTGRYKPLSRPLFLYVRKDALKRAEIAAFVDFYLKEAATLATEVGYVALPKTEYLEARKLLEL